ncbi:uncharacterized protein SETTUDRAFT_92484 [Exserohilum turcica Et28A]|uniref:Rhodopsin domain-containing protein n=1 Tax=Exserohilum turcicum (strain 28A) TaxID=671987 RepID=R0IG31_EXST2|nr:uncharacterized protein SETTUDRAFT_92484 [Exserohilum turcica Et28A]EOA84170.1 hypothetical protein SETTUDRAFT_92484 [Exserohilum turcica Et28A]
MAPTSYPMALSVLIPLPLDIISTILRFWIRTKRNAWGPDDWAMLINVPFWSVSTIATLGMAWSGIGQYDATLTPEQYTNSLRWFYIFQEPWCFTLITIKCSIGFALIRISTSKKRNWDPKMPGKCNDRSIQTVLSYAVVVVSISTDWVFATLPIFLLWNVQLDWRVKGSVMAMLGLGIFASIAPIVRLKFLIGLNDASRLLENLSDILAWASAEMNVGMFVANLPACHPLLKHAIARFSTWTGNSASGRSNDFSSGGFRSKKHSPHARGASTGASKQWLELDDNHHHHAHGGDLEAAAKSNNTTGSGNKFMTGKTKDVGVETKIYGDLDDYSNNSQEDMATDDGSQKRMVITSRSPPSNSDGLHINMQRDFVIEVSKPLSRQANHRV